MPKPLCPTCAGDMSLQATTVHTMLPATCSMCSVVHPGDGEATGRCGAEGTALGNPQVALGKVLLGREKMSLGMQGSCATPSL